jgi:hypothetical protein
MKKVGTASPQGAIPTFFYDWLCFFFPNFVFKEFEYSQIVKGIPLLLKNQGVFFAFKKEKYYLCLD